MERDIPRRDFLRAAGIATTAGAALTATGALAANDQTANKDAAPPPAAAKTDAFPPTAKDMGQYKVLHQFVRDAKSHIPTKGWNYLMGAADTETTMKRNRMALDSIAFKPRVLTGVNKVDMTRDLLGHKSRIPVILSGVGSVALVHPEGGAAVARAAHKFGVTTGVSSEAKPGLEEIGAAAPGPKIYQLYVRGDDAWIDAMADRAIKAGYTTFGFTVDSASFSRRERDIVTAGQNADSSDHPDPYKAGLNWDVIRRFKDRHPNLSIMIKGITCGEDAAIACDAGVAAVWVSTHGGRQLDHGRGAIDILPEVVDAVQGRAQIIVDSGFSRGSDIVKAIAFGATAVGIGRLYCYGLGVGGEDGVVRVLEILEKEIYASMANLGARNLAELNRSRMVPAMPVNPPSMFSAFPLMDTV
jgi:glycolate oxidase